MKISDKYLQWLPSILIVAIMLATGVARSSTVRLELSQAEAISRIRNILNTNAGPCRISSTRSVTAERVKAGWKVSAKIKMSGNTENAIWLVSSANGAAAQNQLTSEIENGCP